MLTKKYILAIAAILSYGVEPFEQFHRWIYNEHSCEIRWKKNAVQNRISFVCFLL